jgi:hypothetical protein
VNHHRVTGVEGEQQVLTAPIDSFDDRVGEARDQFSSGGSANDAFAPDFDINNPSTDKVALQSSSNGLNFR